MSRKTDKTFNHIISECFTSAERCYKQWHDLIETRIYRKAFCKLGFSVEDKWNTGQPEVVVENERRQDIMGFFGFFES